jgi:D-3-phosphoglycerate dehydrogenase
MDHTVLLTDYAWPDDSVERGIIEAAGMRLVSGPAEPLPPAEIAALVRLHRPSAILTCWAQVSAEAIANAPGLRIVARLGIGLDNIAIEAATSRGVWVTNVPDYCVEEVSDHAVGFALAWTRGIPYFDREVRAGHWAPASAQLRRLAHLTCGIVGFGRIGRATARKLGAFGCRLLAYDPYLAQDEGGVRSADLDTLLAESDIVIIHAPLTEATHHLFDRARLARMKPGALLVNVSRGGIVDTDAVVEALKAGRLSAVGLDVIETEPDLPAELRSHPRAMITPHVAFSSDVSVRELRTRAAEEVVRVLQGKAPLEARNKPKAP